MEKYLHRVGRQCEEQKSTTHRIPRKVHPVQNEAEDQKYWNAYWNANGKSLELFKIFKLRSKSYLFGLARDIYPTQKKNERPSDNARRHYGKSRSFHLVMALLHLPFDEQYSSASE